VGVDPPDCTDLLTLTAASAQARIVLAKHQVHGLLDGALCCIDGLPLGMYDSPAAVLLVIVWGFPLWALFGFFYVVWGLR